MKLVSSTIHKFINKECCGRLSDLERQNVEYVKYDPDDPYGIHHLAMQADENKTKRIEKLKRELAELESH